MEKINLAEGLMAQKMEEEAWKDLLGFGDAEHVLSPKSLVESISSRLKEASERYR